MNEFVLGIDIGTTATKAILINKAGDIVASASEEVTLFSLHPGWAEEDPEQWWDNVKVLIPRLLNQAACKGEAITAVGVSGMVPTLICLDENGIPLRKSIQQNDARAVQEVKELQARFNEKDILERTGSAITQQSIAPKIKWLSRFEPDILKKTHAICGSYDYIVRRLTGVASCESNWALESGLYDFRMEQWDQKILSEAGIDERWLGHVYQSSEIVGYIQGNHGTPLVNGTPVVAGSADHVASAFSAGLTQDGDVLIKLGGAGDILFTSSKPITDSRLYLDYHLIPDQFLPNGCMASSGSLIRWFQRELAGDISLEILDKEAEAVGVGADGLIALPYFLGEKTPINDPEARGMFIGLHLGHKRGHLYRAILEGIAFGFAHHLDVFNELGFQPKRIRITNGGSRSRVWRQIVSDVIGLPLESIIEHPGSSLGAAFVAGMGVHFFESWSSINSFIKIEEKIMPNLQNNEKYKRLYKVFHSIYPKLKEQQHILASFSHYS